MSTAAQLFEQEEHLVWPVGSLQYKLAVYASSFASHKNRQHAARCGLSVWLSF